VVSRRSARSQLTRQPSDGGRDFRFTANNGHEHVSRIGLLSATNGHGTHFVDYLVGASKY
jgi:hypothetical protein